MINITTKASFKAVTAVVLALSLVAAPLPFFGETAEAYTRPGYNGKILFEHESWDSPYPSSIYIANPDGSDAVPLITSTTYSLQDGLMSPDGTKIAYTQSNGCCNNDTLMIMNSDGSESRTLVSEKVAFGFDWSPDGTKIVFTSYADGNAEIYTINIEDGLLTRLTNNSSSVDDRAQWSPDGLKIAFRSNRTGDYEIFIMNQDGSDQTNVSQSPSATDRDPLWVPNGDNLIFQSNREGQYELYSLKFEDDSILKLTNSGFYKSFPKISPDGLRVAYTDNNKSIYIAYIDGTNEELISFSSADWPSDANPETASWSPDGKYIISTVWSNEGNNLYIINIESGQSTRVTHEGTSSFAGYPSWLSIPNAPPVTTSDGLTVPYQIPALADVLTNDTDEEALSGDNLSISVQPTNGTASVVDGKVRYAPINGFQGVDSLTYEICDSFMLDQLCSTGVLNITVQAPTAPVLGVGTVGGVGFVKSAGSYITSSLRPTFSGTASPGAEVKVEIHSDPITLTTTADGSGNWSVTPTFDLPSGEHVVYISATLNGLTTELGAFGLTIQPSLADTGANLLLLVAGSLAATLFGGVTLVRRLCTRV